MRPAGRGLDIAGLDDHQYLVKSFTISKYNSYYPSQTIQIFGILCAVYSSNRCSLKIIISGREWTVTELDPLTIVLDCNLINALDDNSLDVVPEQGCQMKISIKAGKRPENGQTDFKCQKRSKTLFVVLLLSCLKETSKLQQYLQTNFSLAASFWGICLLSFFCDD